MLTRSKLVKVIQYNLTDDLRLKKYRGKGPLTGHCYVASEAAYHMLGGPKSGFVPQHIYHENESHWYLLETKTGKILDITAGQFKYAPNYWRGRGTGFLTKHPSRRARLLIRRCYR